MLNHLCRLAFLYLCVKLDQISGISSLFTQVFQTEQPLRGQNSIEQKHLNVLIVGAAMPKGCLAPGRNSGETQGKIWLFIRIHKSWCAKT